MKPFIKAFNAGITLDSMRRNDIVTRKNGSFFQFWGHNVPINCSKILDVRKRNEALSAAFLRGIIRVSLFRIHKIRKNKKMDRNPDPDPEWLLICHM